MLKNKLVLNGVLAIILCNNIAIAQELSLSEGDFVSTEQPPLQCCEKVCTACDDTATMEEICKDKNLTEEEIKCASKYCNEETRQWVCQPQELPTNQNCCGKFVCTDEKEWSCNWESPKPIDEVCIDKNAEEKKCSRVECQKSAWTCVTLDKPKNYDPSQCQTLECNIGDEEATWNIVDIPDTVTNCCQSACSEVNGSYGWICDKAYTTCTAGCVGSEGTTEATDCCNGCKDSSQCSYYKISQVNIYGDRYTGEIDDTLFKANSGKVASCLDKFVQSCFGDDKVQVTKGAKYKFKSSSPTIPVTNDAIDIESYVASIDWVYAGIGKKQRLALFKDFITGEHKYEYDGKPIFCHGISWGWTDCVYLPQLTQEEVDAYVEKYKEYAATNDDECVSQQLTSAGIISSFTYYIDQYNQLENSIYFDENCKVVSPSSEDKLCGDIKFTWAVSPISLVFNPNKNPVSNLVQFDFDLQKNGKWYLWKGSAEMPLLVFDPEHKGEITSSRQLFGTNTFGKAWKNGFEALASLDKNGDKKLTLTELNDLALWFDGNSDAVSQKGEVKLLSEVGVTALFLGKVEETGSINDLIVKEGFEFEGRKLPLLDWFTKPFESKAEAIKEMSGLITPKEVNLKKGNAKPSGLSGVWQWTFTDKEVGHTGLIAIKEINGHITGHTYTEFEIVPDSRKTKENKIKSTLSMYEITGSSKVKNGKVTLSFIVKNKDGEALTLNSAELKEGKLYGKTVAKVDNSDFNYEWIALKK